MATMYSGFGCTSGFKYDNLVVFYVVLFFATLAVTMCVKDYARLQEHRRALTILQGDYESQMRSDSLWREHYRVIGVTKQNKVHSATK